MPGMSTGLNPTDPTMVAAFRAALLHQGVAALIIFGVLALAWVAARDWRPPAGAGSGDAAGAGPGSAGAADSRAAEPSWRRALRVGFGLLWLLDGILQAQPGMAAGLPSQVIEPTAASSPGWAQHLVNWAGTAWSFHPVQAGAAAVWIQVGIGLWLLLAARGSLSRLAGLASAAWGLVVWVFGESLGGILAPGLSWLTGAPGAAAFYCAAGALIALPARAWASPRLGRLFLGGTGLFLAGMAVLAAWPGRGSWAGTVRGQPGPLTSMVQSMAATPQPRLLAALAAGTASFTGAHGFAVNLTAVIALAALGAALAAAAAADARAGGRGGPGPRARGLLRAAVIALGVLCVADWVLVQDFGFFGGLGTDPNSMIPMLVVAAAAYLALVRGPVPALPSPGAAPAPGLPAAGIRLRGRLRPAALPATVAAASARTVLAAGAVGVIALGAVPMAAAQASSAASPILAQAVGGPAAPLSGPAPGFTLTGPDGRPVALAGLRGKAVLLTFLDPVAVAGGPVEARELRLAGQQLGAQDSQVELVAVNLNPVYASTGYTRAFDQEEQLARTPNWLFLTGRPARLRAVWRDYGIASQELGPGGAIGHSDAAFVIGPDGRLREELNFGPGPGTAATQSSFAAVLAAAARQAIAS
jgi:cytochrome oxidase Cu insertion factor (SCO1/SenC/PrrC family)